MHLESLGKFVMQMRCRTSRNIARWTISILTKTLHCECSRSFKLHIFSFAVSSFEELLWSKRTNEKQCLQFVSGVDATLFRNYYWICLFLMKISQLFLVDIRFKFCRKRQVWASNSDWVSKNAFSLEHHNGIMSAIANSSHQNRRNRTNSWKL